MAKAETSQAPASESKPAASEVHDSAPVEAQRMPTAAEIAAEVIKQQRQEAEEAAAKLVPVKAVGFEEIEDAVNRLQMARAELKQPPLSGKEIAAAIGKIQPSAAQPGTKYLLRMAADKDDPGITVVSPDGTFEDAVREFNKNRKPDAIRTAKQLVIVRLAA